MADAPDLGSGAARRGGSSPPSRTKLKELESMGFYRWANRIFTAEQASSDAFDGLVVDGKSALVDWRTTTAIDDEAWSSG
jgi:hypothetical protein